MSPPAGRPLRARVSGGKRVFERLGVVGRVAISGGIRTFAPGGRASRPNARTLRSWTHLCDSRSRCTDAFPVGRASSGLPDYSAPRVRRVTTIGGTLTGQSATTDRSNARRGPGQQPVEKPRPAPLGFSEHFDHRRTQARFGRPSQCVARKPRARQRKPAVTLGKPFRIEGCHRRSKDQDLGHRNCRWRETTDRADSVRSE